jgi:hypothetical protein
LIAGKAVGGENLQYQTRLPCSDRGTYQAVYYRDSRGTEPVDEFIQVLPPKRAAKIDDFVDEHLNGQLPDAQPLPFPITLQIEGELRELRVRFAFALPSSRKSLPKQSAAGSASTAARWAMMTRRRCGMTSRGYPQYLPPGACVQWELASISRDPFHAGYPSCLKNLLYLEPRYGIEP